MIRSPGPLCYGFRRIENLFNPSELPLACPCFNLSLAEVAAAVKSQQAPGPVVVELQLGQDAVVTGDGDHKQQVQNIEG